jgi:hypothetical protein
MKEKNGEGFVIRWLMAEMSMASDDDDDDDDN